jgi:hypothetical protein
MIASMGGRFLVPLSSENRTAAGDVRSQAERALALLEHGLGGFGGE